MIKNIFDCAISAIALIVLLPVLALIALLIRIRMGRPVLFRQVRIGRNEQPFTLYKFRTMTLPGKSPIADEYRLTPVGRLLRHCSLDELPQLWNVVKGDMSLVGPRPLLPEYLPLYGAEHRRRHEVKPGLTGWAQVHGRNLLDWDERLDMDVWYIDHRTMSLDLRIVFLTLLRVISREGIVGLGHVTMRPFGGSLRK